MWPATAGTSRASCTPPRSTPPWPASRTTPNVRRSFKTFATPKWITPGCGRPSSASRPHPPRGLGFLGLLRFGLAKTFGTKGRHPPPLMGRGRRDPGVLRRPRGHRHRQGRTATTKRVLKGLARGQTEPVPLWEESRSATGASGNIRAAVLGVNDGLVSNLSLIMGVSGGTDNTDFILLAGVAGLLAGAFSMAAGEYVSMSSQRDIYEHEIDKQKNRDSRLARRGAGHPRSHLPVQGPDRGRGRPDLPPRHGRRRGRP